MNKQQYIPSLAPHAQNWRIMRQRQQLKLFLRLMRSTGRPMRQWQFQHQILAFFIQ
ncbi:hypothetical protein A2U01_0114731, partial [Trifolium medium]|nr:hypothetical protein [Trifolium medium]